MKYATIPNSNKFLICVNFTNITLLSFQSKLGPCSHCYDRNTNGICKPFSKNPTECVNLSGSNYCATTADEYVQCNARGKLIYNFMVEKHNTAN